MTFARERTGSVKCDLPRGLGSSIYNPFRAVALLESRSKRAILAPRFQRRERLWRLLYSLCIAWEPPDRDGRSGGGMRIKAAGSGRGRETYSGALAAPRARRRSLSAHLSKVSMSGFLPFASSSAPQGVSGGARGMSHRRPRFAGVAGARLSPPPSIRALDPDPAVPGAGPTQSRALRVCNVQQDDNRRLPPGRNPCGGAQR
jgi:hypothetical protein